MVLEIRDHGASPIQGNRAALLEYRTLGLGFANLGGLLMVSGLGYNSDKGRALTAAISALMTGVSYATSATMAKELGAFSGYGLNSNAMLRVMRNHRKGRHTAGQAVTSNSPPRPCH